MSGVLSRRSPGAPPKLFSAMVCLAMAIAHLLSASAVAQTIDVPDGREIVEPIEQCLFPAHPGSKLPGAIEPSRLEVESSFDRSPENVHRIVTRFHVVRRSNGTGGIDETLLDAMMLDLNYGFRNTPFVFVKDPNIVYIDNDDYYADFPTFQSAFDMIRENLVDGVMSWYVTPNINGAVAGTWIRPASPYRGILMAYSTIGSPANIVTPAHEMGHIFQMYHPYETVFAQECTDGRNCDAAGDLICDTPASPMVHSGNTTATGIYFANQSGPCVNDPPYDPNPRLYMDAGWPAGHILRDEFSQGEVDRALSMLEPFALYTVDDLVGPDRPELLVDCDGNGLDDINEILDGSKVDLGRDLKPDVCQTFPAQGDLIVTGMNAGPNNRLRYYDGTTGAWKGDLWNGMSWVHQARLGPDGLVYIARLTIIQRVSLETGRTVDNFIDGVLDGAGTFVDLLFEPSGDILVLDNASQNVRRYDGDSGAYKGVFLNLSASFAPKYMEYGPDGNLYIVGNGVSGNRVLRFNASTGESMADFVSAGSGGLGAGQGLVFHDDGFLYVANGSSNNILRYQSDTGNFESEFVGPGSGGLSNPHSLRFGPGGDLYVASRGTNSVKRYDGKSGAYLGDFVASGAGGSPGTGGLFDPAGLLFASPPRSLSINAGMGGAWTDLEALGQGLFLDVIERDQRIFLGWFTYETDVGIVVGPGENANRWLVAIGDYEGDTATLELLAVSGGTFNGPDAVTETPVGTATLRFSSCTQAVLSYELESGLQGTITLSRLLADALCGQS